VSAWRSNQGAADCVQGDAVGFGVDVVTRAATSMPGCWRRRYRIQALSLPELQETAMRVMSRCVSGLNCVGNPRLFGGREITSYRHAC